MKKTFLGLVVTLSLALAGCSRAPVPRELAAPPETVRKLEQPPFLTDIHGVVFSHDSKWIAAHVGDGISIWSVETGQLVSSFKGADPRNGETMTFSKDGKQLLQGSNVIRTRDVATGKPIKELNIAPREMSRPIFNRDATMAAIIPNNPRDLEIIDVADGKVLLEIPEYWGHLSGHVDFSPDGKTLVARTWSGLVQIWNIGSGGVIRTLRQRDRTSRDLDRAVARFSPDGKYVICREHRKELVGHLRCVWP